MQCSKKYPWKIPVYGTWVKENNKNLTHACLKEVNKNDTIKISLLFNYKNTKYFTLPLSSLHSTNLKTDYISVLKSECTGYPEGEVIKSIILLCFTKITIIQTVYTCNSNIFPCNCIVYSNNLFANALCVYNLSLFMQKTLTIFQFSIS